MWITAALAAAQIISGIAINAKRAAARRAEASGIDKPSSAAVEAVSRARGQAGATMAPGASEDLELARQTSADIVGQAKQTSLDSSKIAAATSRAGLIQAREGQKIIRRGEEFRERSENRLQGALAGLSGEERRTKEAKDKLYMEAQGVQSNLLGAGVNNISTMFRDKNMMDFYGNLFGGSGGGGGTTAPFMGSNWLQGNMPGANAGGM